MKFSWKASIPKQKFTFKTNFYEKFLHKIKFKRPNLSYKQLSKSSLLTQSAIFTILTCSIPILLIGLLFTHEISSSLTEAAIEKNNKVVRSLEKGIWKIFITTKDNENNIKEWTCEFKLWTFYYNPIIHGAPN